MGRRIVLSTPTMQINYTRPSPAGSWSFSLKARITVPDPMRSSIDASSLSNKAWSQLKAESRRTSNSRIWLSCRKWTTVYLKKTFTSWPPRLSRSSQEGLKDIPLTHISTLSMRVAAPIHKVCLLWSKTKSTARRGPRSSLSCRTARKLLNSRTVSNRSSTKAAPTL